MNAKIENIMNDRYNNMGTKEEQGRKKALQLTYFRSHLDGVKWCCENALFYFKNIEIDNYNEIEFMLMNALVKTEFQKEEVDNRLKYWGRFLKN